MSAQTYLSEPVNDFIYRNRTDRGSIRPDRLSLRYVREWSTFPAEAASTISSLNLSATPVSNIESDAENYFVSNETGLMARLVENVFTPVNKCWHAVGSPLCFSDHQASVRDGQHLGTTHNPDVIILDPTRDSNCARAVGEIKTPWTLDLLNNHIRSPMINRRRLSPVLGQLVRYMREKCLRLGFISSYTATIFVRRCDLFAFEVTMPIKNDQTNPSLREAMFAFGLLADSATLFEEPDDFEETILASSFTSGNTRSSLNLLSLAQDIPHSAPPTASLPPFPVSSNTMFVDLGEPDLCRIDCTRMLKGEFGDPRCVFEGVTLGKRVVAKFWNEELASQYDAEVHAYQRIAAGGGADQFVSIHGAGKVMVAAVSLPPGYLMIMEHFEGRAMDTFTAEEIPHHVYDQLLGAVRYLRSLDLWISDPRCCDVLLGDRGLRIVDLESVEQNEYEFDAENGPEMEEWGPLIRCV